MNIVLIGLRGCGKTTVGQLLAKKTKYQFIDTDIYLSETAGKSIPEIVKQSGWGEFRNLEEKIIKEVSKRKNTVIATGGGVVERENNIINLKKGGKVFWLYAKVDTLLKRIGQDTNRPALTKNKSPKQEMELIFNKRKNLYSLAADVIIKTDTITPDETVKQILKQL